MKKVILITIAICTLNGCGLFNKVSKQKDKEVFKTHLDVVNKLKEDIVINKTINKSDSNLTIDKSGIRSTIKGNLIKIDSKGNIECQNCEVEQQKQNDISELKNKKTNSNTNTKKKIKSESNVKTGLEKAITKEVLNSDPKSFSIISNYIGAAIFLVIVIVGGFYFISRKKK